jgi:hypothetical protein
MAIELVVEPRKVYSWDEFRAQKPRFSIGLDGIISAPVQRDPAGPYANFDHHTGADRLSTASTAEQAHMEINMGLYDTFQEKGAPKALLHVNDPDEDTCLAVWLLSRPDQIIHHACPQINRLVYCEGKLDVTAGAYPFGTINIRRQMAWIFEPYNDARFRNKLRDLDASGMRTLIEAVGARITDHVMGQGKEIPLEGSYERIGGGTGWVFTKENSPASRMAMYNEGVKAFVALVAKKGESFTYSIGRTSVWTPFPLEQFYNALNEEETVPISDRNKWGGSNTIGGSPRETGSRLNPVDVQRVIEKTLANPHNVR